MTLVIMSTYMVNQKEFLFHKQVTDMLINNHFDSSHNSFHSIRRISDIYEYDPPPKANTSHCMYRLCARWGLKVLWPGLLGNAGPCAPTGQDLDFRSSQSMFAPSSSSVRVGLKGCVDYAWPDGAGPFHLASATPYSIDELVELTDMFDWFQGILFRTVRAAPMSPQSCGTPIFGSCFGALTTSDEGIATEPYGYNWTDPSQPLEHPWTYFTSEQLGVNGARTQSGSLESYGVKYPPGGYAAVVIPFLSPKFLPEQKGTHDQARPQLSSLPRPSPPPSALPALPPFRPPVRRCHRLSRSSSRKRYPHPDIRIPILITTPSHPTQLRPNQACPRRTTQVIDFKAVRCDRRKSNSGCTPKHLCVRLSWNGAHIHQLCDPMHNGRVTGVVRAAIESFWSELARVSASLLLLPPPHTHCTHTSRISNCVPGRYTGQPCPHAPELATMRSPDMSPAPNSPRALAL